MKAFRKILGRIGFTMNETLIFRTIIDTIVIFLAGYLILSLFYVDTGIAYVIAFVYLVFVGYIRYKEDKAKMIEKKYTALDEKLRTAIDNVTLENPIVEELQKEVVNDLQNVKISKFIGERGISYKVLLAVILAFLILVLASFDFYLINIDMIPKKIGSYLVGGNESGGDGIGDLLRAGKDTREDIYGEESVAALGDKELEIEIRPVSQDIIMRDIKDAEEKEFIETFPSEITATSTEALEENIPMDQQELVKEYFKSLAKD